MIIHFLFVRSRTMSLTRTKTKTSNNKSLRKQKRRFVPYQLHNISSIDKETMQRLTYMMNTTDKTFTQDSSLFSSATKYVEKQTQNAYEDSRMINIIRTKTNHRFLQGLVLLNTLLVIVLFVLLTFSPENIETAFDYHLVSNSDPYLLVHCTEIALWCGILLFEAKVFIQFIINKYRYHMQLKQLMSYSIVESIRKSLLQQ